jgi:hypothetical protein
MNTDGKKDFHHDLHPFDEEILFPSSSMSVHPGQPGLRSHCGLISLSSLRKEI